MKFKIGEKVIWRGVEGVVISFNLKKKTYRIALNFSVVETPESELSTP